MTNEDVFQNLLTAQVAEPLKVPTHTLLDWINTIPNRAAYRYARTAFLKRVPEARSFFQNYPHTSGSSDIEHRIWLTATFQPPVYSICDQTGERLLIRQDFLERYGLLDNTPQKVYRMPEGLDEKAMRDWLFADRDEKDAIYSDNDGNEYDLVEGQFIPKSRIAT